MPRRRQRHLHVMLNDGEAAALGRLCEASGSTPSEALRQMIIASDSAARDGSGASVVVIDPAGYSSASARPYDSIKLQVRKVVIHPSWTQVGMTNAGYLFNSFQSMTEVSGFENLSGITNAAQMFTS